MCKFIIHDDSSFGLLVTYYIVCRSKFIRGSAEATRHASNLVTVFLREQDKEIENNQSSGKRSTAAPTGPGSQSSAPSGSTLSANQPDTMSSIGTFSIADFIVTSQVCSFYHSSIECLNN